MAPSKSRSSDVLGSARFTRSRTVFSRTDAKGEVMIVSLSNTSHYFTLKGISAEFWQSIKPSKPIAAIVDSFIAKHKLPEKRFKADVERLLKGLLKEKLISRVKGAGTRSKKR